MVREFFNRIDLKLAPHANCELLKSSRNLPFAYSGDSDHSFWFYSITRSSQRDELMVHVRISCALTASDLMLVA